MRWRGPHHPGGEEFWTRRKGGRKILDKPSRGGEEFWTSRQGGAKIFGLGQYFFKSLKPDFFMFWGVLGTLNFWVQGGAKNFGRVIWGGEKFWTCHLGGAKNFGF